VDVETILMKEPAAAPEKESFEVSAVNVSQASTLIVPEMSSPQLGIDAAEIIMELLFVAVLRAAPAKVMFVVALKSSQAATSICPSSTTPQLLGPAAVRVNVLFLAAFTAFILDSAVKLRQEGGAIYGGVYTGGMGVTSGNWNTQASLIGSSSVELTATSIPSGIAQEGGFGLFTES
jgi:hypothetical protein